MRDRLLLPSTPAPTPDPPLPTRKPNAKSSQPIESPLRDQQLAAVEQAEMEEAEAVWLSAMAARQINTRIRPRHKPAQTSPSSAVPSTRVPIDTSAASTASPTSPRGVPLGSGSTDSATPAPSQATGATPAPQVGSGPSRPATPAPKTAPVRDPDHARFGPVLQAARDGKPSEDQLRQWIRIVRREQAQFASDAKSATDPAAQQEAARRASVVRFYADELGLCLDTIRVAETKRQAKQIYVGAGKAATMTPTDLTTPDRPTKPAPKGKKGKKGKKDAPAPGLGALTPDMQAHFADEAARLKPAGQALAQQCGLDTAETLALMTYCLNDYRYVNPATAFSASWLAQAVTDARSEGFEQYGTLKQRMEEGGLHMGMLMSALIKLPNQSVDTFRGERLSKEMFDERFAQSPNGAITSKTASVTRAASWSASRKMKTATDFVNSPVQGKPIGIVYEIAINNGRDISPFSPFDEAETLCPPGSVYAYGPGRKVDPKTIGIGAVTECYIVPVTQTWSRLP